MNEPRLYRKKPVVIEAFLWEGGVENATPVILWMLESGGSAGRYHEHVPKKVRNGFVIQEAIPEHIAIDTLEGTMRASVGDYIIRGINGEFYPCKPEIFEATYETVD